MFFLFVCLGAVLLTQVYIIPNLVLLYSSVIFYLPSNFFFQYIHGILL